MRAVHHFGSLRAIMCSGRRQRDAAAQAALWQRWWGISWLCCWVGWSLERAGKGCCIQGWLQQWQTCRMPPPHHAMQNGCQPCFTEATSDGGVSRPTLRLPWYQQVNQAVRHNYSTALHSTPCSLTAPHAASQRPRAMPTHCRSPFSMGRAQAWCLQHVVAAAGVAAGCV